MARTLPVVPCYFTVEVEEGVWAIRYEEVPCLPPVGMVVHVGEHNGIPVGFVVAEVLLDLEEGGIEVLLEPDEEVPYPASSLRPALQRCGFLIEGDEDAKEEPRGGNILNLVRLPLRPRHRPRGG